MASRLLLHRAMAKRCFSLGWLAVASILAPACAGTGGGGDGEDSVEMAESSELRADVLDSRNPAPARCGGFAGIPCPAGYRCEDDPRDSCDPARGGADCIGICVWRGQPDCRSRHRPDAYVSRDPRHCRVIRFYCV